MKTRSIFALLAVATLGFTNVQAAGLLSEADLLSETDKEIEIVKPLEKTKVADLKAEALGDLTGEVDLQLPATLPATSDRITVKVFGAAGRLVASQELALADFVAGQYSVAGLPSTGKFVMFHDNTAYFLQH